VEKPGLLIDVQGLRFSGFSKWLDGQKIFLISVFEAFIL
jgi:hypothetical protein